MNSDLNKEAYLLFTKTLFKFRNFIFLYKTGIFQHYATDLLQENIFLAFIDQ